MACPIIPADCVGDTINSGLQGLADSAFEQVVKSFVTAANTLLESFAKAFSALKGPDLGAPGITNIYATSLGIAALIACLLLLGQIIRTVVTHDGSGLAHGFIGLGKAAMAIMMTMTVTTAGLKASDELTDFIIERTFGSTKVLTNKITNLISWNNASAAVGQASALLLILAVVGILLTLVLWFELLLRNAAVVVLVATSPIAAAGQVNETTRDWWTKAAVSTAQLIILKPIIALVFALGFGMTGESKDLSGLLSGMLVLILAVFAWPAIARFFSFASVAVGGASGLGVLLGFAAGQSVKAGGARGGSPVGTSPDQFSQAIEGRTMANFAGEAGGFAKVEGSGVKGGAASGAGGTAGAGAGVAGLAIAAVQAGQKAINSLAGGMDQMASHGGMHGRSAHYAAGAPVNADGYGHRGREQESQGGFQGGYRGRDGEFHGRPTGPADETLPTEAPSVEPVAHTEAAVPADVQPESETAPPASQTPDREPDLADMTPPAEPVTQSINEPLLPPSKDGDK